jgi:hypothetical protein
VTKPDESAIQGTNTSGPTYIVLSTVTPEEGKIMVQALFFFPLIGFFPFFGFGSFLYFLPFIVGLARGKRDLLAIFLLNFFLGWTLIGWVVALIWAVKQEVYYPARQQP